MALRATAAAPPAGGTPHYRHGISPIQPAPSGNGGSLLALLGSHHPLALPAMSTAASSSVNCATGVSLRSPPSPEAVAMPVAGTGSRLSRGDRASR